MSTQRPEEAVDRGPLLRTAPVFAALGEETRLRLVTRLSSEGPLSIAQLTTGGRVTRQAVTKHLQVLAQAGLAHDWQVGRERIWELQTEPLLSAGECLNQISAQWDEALGRLTQFLEQREGVSPNDVNRVRSRGL